MDGEGHFQKDGRIMNSLFRIVACVTLTSTASAWAERILFHSGPIVFSPDAILLDPIDKEREEKSLQFIYEFFIEAKTLRQLFIQHGGDPPIPPGKAIELTVRSVDDQPGNDANPPKVSELKEYQAADGFVIRYYLVTVHVHQSAETHRVVLMDGTILKPKLRRVVEK